MHAPFTAHKGAIVNERSNKRLVIFDCDNFLTMGWKEGEKFIERYPTELAAATGIPEQETQEQLKCAADQVRANSNAYGMRDLSDRIIAPTFMDAYVYMRVLAGLTLDACERRYGSEREREEMLHAVHKKCYDPKPIFREGAKELVQKWRAHPDVGLHIVTGSDTKPVEGKMQILLGHEVEPGFVVGNAGKHLLTMRSDTWSAEEQAAFEPMWEQTRVSFPFPGAGYDAYPQRGFYYRVLMDLQSRYNADRRAHVAGDSLHCDGLLPMELEMTYIHLATEYTPEWEKDFVRESGCGLVAPNLAGVDWFLDALVEM